MISIKTTFSTPEENLAYDEALIEAAEICSSELSTSETTEVLRLWEMPQTCVVLGRASKRMLEAHVDNCERDFVPVLRRFSGGASIVAGPGCLMYSALISYEERPHWRMLDTAHAEAMKRVRDSVQKCLDSFETGAQVLFQGTCDLTINDRKFSGNALRCKRNWMLYHGTIMISMPVAWIGRYLREPARQPEYRAHRHHEDFVTNLIIEQPMFSAEAIRTNLERHLEGAWQAKPLPIPHKFSEAIQTQWEALRSQRYSDHAWHTQL
ncbi:MAG: lipoate--protein ligase family protein [Pirellula sp.]